MLGVDCQLDRVEWQIVGFGREYRRYVVDYGTIGKHIAEPDCQRNLDLLLARKWTNFCGCEMAITLAAIDANYATDDVLNYARRYPSHKLIAVRGAHGDAAPRIAKVQRERNEKLGTVLKYSNRFYNIGVPAPTLSHSIWAAGGLNLLPARLLGSGGLCGCARFPGAKPGFGAHAKARPLIHIEVPL
jgi:phage terminase large subunit GpA-like protein